MGLNVKDLLGDLGEVAELLAPLVPGGGAVVAVGKKVVEIIDKAQADGPDPTLEEKAAALKAQIARVNANVDEAIDALRG